MLTSRWKSPHTINATASASGSEMFPEAGSRRTSANNRAHLTAHPKIDPKSGEMHAMVYAPSQWFDHTQYVVVGTDGRVRRTVDVPMGMSMLDDMSLTQRYAVVYDLPVTVDLDLAFAGSQFPFAWNPDYGARVGLLPREGVATDIVWIDVPICYAYHPMNAYDPPDGYVCIDICTYDRMFDNDRNGPFGDSLPRLERWEIYPDQRRSRVTVIDETPQEFPRHAHAVGSQEYRYGNAAQIGTDQYGATIKHDLKPANEASTTTARVGAAASPCSFPARTRPQRTMGDS